MSDHREHLAKLLSLGVHEFRTPVAVVSGYLRMLLRHFGDNLTDQQRKLIEEAEKSCANLTALIAEQSELAQIEDGRIAMRRDSIPLFTLLKQVASSVHEAEDRGVVLSVRDEGLEAVVVGDRERLQSALASLLTAALRERANAGIVVAACARVRATEGGESAVIAIADGDEAERLAAAIGEPPPSADTFDQYRGGMGFKLPLAARIVEAHGGRVTSPVAARGRLSILLSLPVATEPENAA